MSIYKELSYDAEIDQVRGIQFSVLSPDEIRKRSVVEITTNEGYVGNKPVDGGLFDPRMGVLDHGQRCSTCGQTNIFCPGHFAHINLARPMYHAMFFDTTIKVLKCVCFRCSKPLITPIDQPSGQLQQKQQEELKKAMGIKNLQKRFDAIYKIINPSNTSTNKGIRCGDNNADGCGARQPKIVKENMMRLVSIWKNEAAEKKEDKEIRKEVPAEDALRIFQRITEKDMEMLGFNPQWNRPEWMICTVLPVPPPAVRPSIIEENGRREDDLTHKLSDIIKYNQQLKQKIESGNANQDHFNTLSMLLQIHTATFLNNQIPGVPAAQQRNGRKLKSIADRLKKKEGRIRGNLNGKRVDQSARSVITPDPYISIDELGVPIRVAMNLTFPEIVNENNMEEMQRLVRNGPDTWPGAKYLRIHSKHTVRLKNADRDKIANEISVGDIVDRHLRDGDYVLFNRQPSLHKMSMMCHRVKVMPYQTFRLNPTVCAPYNADKPMLARGRCPQGGKPF